MTTLVESCSVLDSSKPSGYRTGVDIVISDERFIEVGLPQKGIEPDTTIDGSSLLAVPGLINAHTHSPENALRGTTERLPLELWLIRNFEGRKDLSPELTYLTTLVGGIEMVLSGTTSVLDHFLVAQEHFLECVDAAYQAYADLGMRATLAPMIEDRDFVLDQLSTQDPRIGEGRSNSLLSTESLLRATQEIIAKWHGEQNGTLRCMPGPGGSQWCSDELLLGAVQLASHYETGLHIHVSETELQERISKSVFGRSGIGRLAELGFLTPATSLAHCVWVDQSDLLLIAASGATVVHNPVSNLKLGSGVAPIRQMLSQHIPVALGSDGAGSNDTQNMWETVKTACLIHSPALSGEDGWLSSRDAVSMATTMGARALGQEDVLGQIEAGRLADLVLIDLTENYLDPLPDAFGYLVYASTAPRVRHVFVNGKHIVKDGDLVTVNGEKVRSELRKILTAHVEEESRDTNHVRRLEDLWRRAIERYARA